MTNREGHMPTEALFKLHARNSQEFSENGERESFDRFLVRVCPDMNADSRKRVSRQIARGLDLFGREAMNQAIDDIDLFEARLRATPLKRHGYKASIGPAVQNAARYLHAAARDADQADLRAIRTSKRRTRINTAKITALPVQRMDAAEPYRGRTPRPKAKRAADKEQRPTSATQPAVHGLPAAPTLADIDSVLKQLAGLQRKLGTWDGAARAQVSTMLVETLSDPAVLQLLAVVGGYDQPVVLTQGASQQRSVAGIARQALEARLSERCSRH